MSKTAAPAWRTMKPGAKLDALVAERVMGWFQRVDYGYRPPQIEWQDKNGFRALVNDPDQLPNLPLWSPSGDLIAAWQVVEAMRARGWFLTLTHLRGGMCGAEFWRNDPEQVASGMSKDYTDPALAICRAALAALELEGVVPLPAVPQLPHP